MNKFQGIAFCCSSYSQIHGWKVYNLIICIPFFSYMTSVPICSRREFYHSYKCWLLCWSKHVFPQAYRLVMVFIKKMALCYCFHSKSSKDQFLNLLISCKEIYYPNNDAGAWIDPITDSAKACRLTHLTGSHREISYRYIHLTPGLQNFSGALVNMSFFIKVSHRKLIWTNPILKIA